MNNLQIPEIMAYIFFFILLIAVFVLVSKKKGEIWSGILGENKILDMPEIIILVWLILFPVLVLSELFFKLSVSYVVWASMDIILISTLGGKAILDKNNKSKNDENI